MNQLPGSDPNSEKPPARKRAEFVISTILVWINLLIGFLAFKPESTSKLVIAIVATIAIGVCFCLRRAWAWATAIIVAAFGIFVSLFGGIFTVLDLANPSDNQKLFAWIQLLVAAATIYWLRRGGVKAWFPLSPKNH